MLSISLLVLSAGVILLLGSGHMFLTFRGNRLHPRDPDLLRRMQVEHPRLTRETTMWKAWVGFNASHSLGAILFGAVYGYLALVEPVMLFASPFLLGVGFAMLVGLTLLARRYWFRIPRGGIVLALACYAAGVFVSLA